MITQNEVDRALQLLDACDTIALTSVGEDGYPRSAVMTKLENDGLKTFYFFASSKSNKVRNLLANPKASLCWYSPGGSVSLMGDVDIALEQGIRERCWRDWLAKAFPQGPSDPGFTVLRFTAHEASLCFAGKVQSHRL